MQQITTKCPICKSNDLEFEEKTVGCRVCMEIIYDERTNNCIDCGRATENEGRCQRCSL